MNEMLDRLNELAWKNRTEGLTEEEQAERAALRERYVAAVRGSLEAHLESIVIEDEDGNRTKLRKKDEIPSDQP